MTSAEALHKGSIIIDGVCPLTMEKANVDWYFDGGVTVAVPTAAIRPTEELIPNAIFRALFPAQSTWLALCVWSKEIEKQKKKVVSDVRCSEALCGTLLFVPSHTTTGIDVPSNDLEDIEPLN